jgi:predicted DNA binding CopG/RHH family protein
MELKNPVKKRNRNPEHTLRQLLDNPAYWEKMDAEMARFEEERASKRKDSILHLRINSRDLARLKEKAKAAGLGYQTFIAEILHRVAH